MEWCSCMVPIHSGVVQSDSSSNRPTISGKGLNKEELKMAAELKMVEELQALRQEVITSYLSNQRNNRNSTGSGGHKRKQETDSGCLVNNASIMVNPFYRLGQASPCCVTLKKPRRSLEEMQQRLLASHLRSMFRNFYRDTSTGIRGISVGKGPTCIEFDTEGALFAVAESDGQLRVFDFDESLAKFSRLVVSVCRDTTV